SLATAARMKPEVAPWHSRLSSCWASTDTHKLRRGTSCASHLLERLAVARIRRVRQKDDAPEVQRRLLRPTYTMSDMKEGPQSSFGNADLRRPSTASRTVYKARKGVY